jgi:hypothetical protein
LQVLALATERDGAGIDAQKWAKFLVAQALLASCVIKKNKK